MMYTKESPLFEPEKEVIKLTLEVNSIHYPNFPKEIWVSEYNLQQVLSNLRGLDYSIKKALNLSDEEYYKTWIAYSVRVEHTTKENYFGMNGNTLVYNWR